MTEQLVIVFYAQKVLVAELVCPEHDRIIMFEHDYRRQHSRHIELAIFEPRHSDELIYFQQAHTFL